jgi:branched-chain amino acid transport system substrate-binding protein
MNHRLCGALAVAASAMLLAACGTDSASHASSGSGPIEIVALQALSGDLAASAQVDVAALKAAVAVVNQAGGVDGRKVTLDVLDDKGDGTQGVSLLRGLIDSGHKPDILVDGTSTPESLALQPLVSQYNIVAISTSTGGLSLDPSVSKNKTKFTTTPDVDVLAKSAADYLAQKGYHKVALLSSSDSYGNLWAAAYQKAITAAGLQVSAAKTFDLTALDVTPQLQALQASQPDVLVAEAYGPPAGYVLTDREKLGWTGTPFVGAVTFAVADLTKLVEPGALKNVTIQSPAVEQYRAPEAMSANFKTFLDAVKAQGPVTSAISGYAYEYDTIQLAVAAIKKAGSTDPQKVTAALENLGPVSTTVIQPTYFTSTSHFPGPSDSAYVFLTPGPLVDGMIKS